MKAFADALAKRCRTRSQEYMELAKDETDPRRDRLITRAIAFSEIADLVALAVEDVENATPPHAARKGR